MLLSCWLLDTGCGMSHYEASVNAEGDPRYPNEPEWMPPEEEVARARLAMERQGVVAALNRGTASVQLAAPGETPWLWLGTAVAWLLIWPATLALQWTGGGVVGLPGGVAPALAVLHLLVLAWPVLAAGRLAGTGALSRRFSRIQTLAQMLALEPGEFEVWTGMLFRLLGYRSENTQDVADHGIDLVVSNGSIHRGLVQCKRYRGTVGEPTVRDLYGTLIHEGADYAWLVTTGGISRQAREWAGGKPIELWDGQKLVGFVQKYRP